MTKAFTKGQTVTLVQDWDRKGSVAVTPAIVYSCGKKQMVLTHAQTGAELGRNFQPVADAEGWAGEFVLTGTATDEQALELAQTILTARREQYERLAATGRDFAKELADLHEPRIVRR